MGFPYQVKDRQLLDYGMEQLHGEWFRGPLDRGPDSIAWLGAAQTFGRYVSEPFPAIVGKRLGIGTLNLGSGGKGPGYYLRHLELLEEVNRCRAAVVQVMSAKGSDNSLFRSSGGGDSGIRLDTGARTKSLALIYGLRSQGKSMRARRVAWESQRSFTDEMQGLLGAIRPPKILLWIAFREPPSGVSGYRTFFQKVSPQFVTRRVLSRIEPFADRFVEVVSTAGVPQIFRDEDGKTLRKNPYYPSPEMHRLAADRLAPVLEELIG